jgi:uncharacterized membrane protein YvbJ
MSYCENCGEAMQEDYCYTCGTYQPPPFSELPADMQPSDAKICSNCGNRFTYKYCRFCGHADMVIEEKDIGFLEKRWTLREYYREYWPLHFASLISGLILLFIIFLFILFDIIFG